MAEYAVRTENVFANLDGATTSKKKKKKKKKKSGNSNTVDDGAQVQVGITVDQVEPDTADGFVVPRHSRKQAKRNKKQQQEAEPEAEVENNARKSPGKRVSFSSRPSPSQKPSSSGSNRRTSLKRSAVTLPGTKTDTGMVKLLVGLGYSVSDIIDAMDKLPHNKKDNEVAVLKLLQAQAEKKVAEHNDVEPPVTKLEKIVKERCASPVPVSPRKAKKTKSSRATKASPKPEPVATPSPEPEDIPEDKPLSLRERIEAQAAAWTPSDGSDLLEHWISQLDEVANAKKHGKEPRAAAALYAKTLIESQGIENLVTGILSGKLRGRQPRLESIVVKLFGRALLGTKKYHEWLLTALKSVGKSIEACSNRQAYTSLLLDIVTKQKQGHIATHQVNSIIAGIKPTVKPRSKQSSTQDPLTSLQEEATVLTDHLAQHQLSLTSLRQAMSKEGSIDDQQSTVATIEHKVKTDMQRSKSLLAQHEAKRAGVVSKQSQLDTDKKTRLSSLMKAEADFAREKQTLVDRRKVLERELAQVDMALQNLQSAQDKNSLNIAKITEEFKMSDESLRTMDTELAFQMATLAKNESAGNAMLRFVHDLSSRTTQFVQDTKTQQLKSFHSVCRQLFKATQEYVLHHQKFINTLQDRVKFCSNKVNQARQDRSNMVSLGLNDAANSDQALEQQMASMIKQDSLKIKDVTHKVNSTIRSVAQLVDSSVNLAETGYHDFHKTLTDAASNGNLAFNLSPLPKPATREQAKPAPQHQPKQKAVGPSRAPHGSPSIPPGFGTPSPFADALHQITQATPETKAPPANGEELSKPRRPPVGRRPPRRHRGGPAPTSNVASTAPHAESAPAAPSAPIAQPTAVPKPAEPAAADLFSKKTWGKPVTDPNPSVSVLDFPEFSAHNKSPALSPRQPAPVERTHPRKPPGFTDTPQKKTTPQVASPKSEEGDNTKQADAPAGKPKRRPPRRRNKIQ